MTRDLPNLFLGIDGGQSHTEAVVADEHGNVLGRGLGGPSNHAERPGGRERLRAAVTDSAAGALRHLKIGGQGGATSTEILQHVEFAAAHCAMTGGADFKQEIVGKIINTPRLAVAHDAPAALYGATGGKPGIIAIAGTGSVVYGENAGGESAQVGGLGYVFSDEGSGFWLAAQAIRLAIKEQDGLIVNAGLQDLVLEFFDVGAIRDLTSEFYNEIVTRDEIAKFAVVVAHAAENGNEVLAAQIIVGCQYLADAIRVAANRLKFEEPFAVAGVGGMFRGNLMSKCFAEAIKNSVPNANIYKPRFGPAVGALLLAYRESGIAVEEEILTNLARSIEND